MCMSNKKTVSFIGQLFHQVSVVFGAILLTLVFFLVLPLMQTIAKSPTADLVIQQINTIEPPPPDPIVEEEQEEEPPQEPEKLELEPDTTPLTLDQLSLALNPGGVGGWAEGDFALNLSTITASGGNVDALFSIADLDQKPRAIYQPGPTLNKEMRANTPATVYIIFVVDKDGRVTDPKVQKSTSPIFDRSALNAVKKWKFEPGKSGGKAVRFRMRVPVTFPKGN